MVDIDGFVSKPHNSFFSETHFMFRNLLKIQFVNIKHIKMRRKVNHFLASSEHSTKMELQGLTLDAKLSSCNNVYIFLYYRL